MSRSQPTAHGKGPSEPVPSSGSLGILSQTVFQSPDYKFISQARIREYSYYDFVLVGEHVVHVEQVITPGNLLHVATKSDFPSRIRSTGVLGYFGADDDICNLVPARGSYDLESKRPPPGPTTRQVLLLTFETPSNMLYLLSLDPNPSGTHAFSVVPIHFPVPEPSARTSAVRSLGKHVAVDPYSRAVAIGASSKYILLYEAGPVSGNLQDVLKRSALIHLEGDMVIAKIAFLYPELERDDLLHLLVVGHIGRRFTIALYQWSRTGPLDPRIVQQGLPGNLSRDHGIPTVLVPFARTPGAFMLICDRSVAVYLDAHRGNIRQILLRASSHTKSTSQEVFFDWPCEEPAFSCRAPLWKAWSRPRRNGLAAEGVYLCREDGCVCYFEMRNDDSSRYTFKPSHAGYLGSHVDSAFADVEFLDLYKNDRVGQHHDGILFGGGFCDGGLFGIGSKAQPKHYPDRTRLDIMDFEHKEHLYNWAPFCDLEKVPRHPTTRSEIGTAANGGLTPPSKEPERLFATCGKAPQGALCELRYGCEVRLYKEIFLDYYARSTRFWFFEEPGYCNEFLLSTMPGNTVVIHKPFSDPEMQDIRTEETLAAGTFHVPVNEFSAPLVLILIGPSAIQLFEHDTDPPSLTERRSWEVNVTMAAIEPRSRLILSATGCKLTLQQLNFVRSELNLQDLSLTFSLNDEPTCLYFLDQRVELKQESSSQPKHTFWCGNLYAVVGCRDGSIVILKVDPKQGLTRELRYTIEGPMAICESIAAISDTPDVSETTYLLCGLRNGCLQAIELRSPMGNPISATGEAQYRIGHSPVHVQTRGTDRLKPKHAPTALINCQGAVFLLHFTKSDLRHPTVNSVYLVKRDDPTFSPTAISSITPISETQLPLDNGSDGTSINTLSICGDELVLGRLQNQPIAIPRRIAMRGAPGQTIYSSQFRSLIASSTLMRVEKGRRFTWPVVFIIDPDRTQADQRSEDDTDSTAGSNTAPVLECPTGSAITCMFEWHFERSARIQHFLVVGTTDSQSSGKPNGSLKFYRMHQKDNGRILASLFQDLSQDEAVYTICQYENDKLLFCSGKNMMQTFQREDGKLHKANVLSLDSRPCHVSVRGTLVFVSTQQYSMAVYKFSRNELVPVTSDDKVRNGLSHLVTSASQVALFSTKKQSVAGIRLPPTDIVQDLLFDAHLHPSIIRLCQASVRPFCKRRNVNGVVESDILGVSSGGSLHTFELLTEPLWRLLRLIQNMCMRDPRITQPASAACSGLLEPVGAPATEFHVDGDALRRLSDRKDAEQILKQMIETQSEHAKPLDSPDRRRRRFKELLGEALGEALHQRPSKTVNDSRRMVDRTSSSELEARAIDLLRTLLELPL